MKNQWFQYVVKEESYTKKAIKAIEKTTLKQNKSNTRPMPLLYDYYINSNEFYMFLIERIVLKYKRPIIFK